MPSSEELLSCSRAPFTYGRPVPNVVCDDSNANIFGLTTPGTSSVSWFTSRVASGSEVTSFAFSTVPTSVEETCSRGASPLTCTVVLTRPTASAKSTRATWLTTSSNAERSCVWNPWASTLIAMVPTGIWGNS